MSIHEDDRAWRRDSGLVDPDVDLDTVRIHSSGLPSLYLRIVRHSAITFGDRFSLREESRRRDVPLIVHELVHVAQYRRLGFVRFLVRYGHRPRAPSRVRPRTPARGACVRASGGGAARTP